MDSMEDLFRKNGDIVYKYLLSITRNADISEDLSQETFYQAFKNINKFDGSSKITTWLCAIAKNLYYEYIRKNKNISDLEIQNIIDKNLITASTEDIFIENISKVELLKIIQNQGSPQKDVIHLRMYGNLSFKEIGEVMNKNENWARVTFHRAKANIRKELDNEK